MLYIVREGQELTDTVSVTICFPSVTKVCIIKEKETFTLNYSCTKYY